MRKTYLDTDSEIDDDPEDDPIKQYKIICIGPRESGKTSLINRLRSNNFSIQYRPTKMIEIYNDVTLGDIKANIWDVPPNICKFYNVSTLESDVLLVMFDSDKESSFKEAIKLFLLLRDKLYKDHIPELWFVYRGQKKIENTEYCHPDRLFHIDNMSRDGIIDLIYDIRCKLLNRFT
tara:strand:- start:3377 stop:3907 length:531 start_codon:yes stop_codon:yes gene_type:complete